VKKKLEAKGFKEPCCGGCASGGTCDGDTTLTTTTQNGDEYNEEEWVAQCCCVEDINIKELTAAERAAENERMRSTGVYDECGFGVTVDFSWHDDKEAKEDRECMLEWWECATHVINDEGTTYPPNNWADKSDNDRLVLVNDYMRAVRTRKKSAKMKDLPGYPKALRLDETWGVLIYVRVYSAPDCNCVYEMVEATYECCVWEEPGAPKRKVSGGEHAPKKRYTSSAKPPPRGTKPTTAVTRHPGEECDACVFH
jgi:hypothetical protein